MNFSNGIRLATDLDTSEVLPPTLASICPGVAAILPISGVALILLGTGQTQGVASALEGRAKAMLDLELTLGEGPMNDASLGRWPVKIDDLTRAKNPWPHFTSAALGLGVRSVYGLPLRSRLMTMGVLTLSSEVPRALSGHDYERALVVADLVGKLVLVMQAGSPLGVLAPSLEAGDLLAIVHQATGMASTQIECSVDEALLRLRGHAFSSGQTVEDLAKAVICGQVRFDAAR